MRKSKKVNRKFKSSSILGVSVFLGSILTKTKIFGLCSTNGASLNNLLTLLEENNIDLLAIDGRYYPKKVIENYNEEK